MTYDELEPLRRTLLSRRRDLMTRQRVASRDERELVAEREPDWLDAAALDAAATVLETLGESERTEVEEIDAALARMARGTYGLCATCGESIAADRIHAVPECSRCERCSSSAA
jgi:RNA polymerase-binding transcription factor DksA